MASRGGFLVGDGVLRRRKPAQKPGHATSKQAKTTKRKKMKPEWDSTVTDLNVYKATEEELRTRHVAHKSKNAGIGIQNRTSDKENSPANITTPNSAQRKHAILQEILYGHDKFQDVLAESDKTMSVVKDLFGDDPKKYLGFPNVTVPPQKQEDDLDRYKSGPIADVPETPTQLSILSDSVMRTPALNDISDAEDGASSESEPSPQNGTNGVPQRFTFEPKLDVQRFKHFVTQEQFQHGQQQPELIPQHQDRNVQNPSYEGSMSQAEFARSVPQETGSGLLFNGTGNTVLAGDPNFMRQVPQQSPGVPTAVASIPPNERSQTGAEKPKAMKKEKRSKVKSKAGDQNTSSSASSGLKSLEDLKKMVESLENEITEYEMETGRQPSNTAQQASSFSGYTSALIMAVTKLMRYLKESASQRRAEAVMRDQILQGFAEQRTLIDALTNDILLTQEQNILLKEDLQSYRKTTDQQLEYLKRELHTVLKSFEYHTVQSTINTLHSTQPITLQGHGELSTSTDKEPLPGSYSQPNQQSGHTSRIQTEGAFIPVSGSTEHKKEDSTNDGNALPQKATDPHENTLTELPGPQNIMGMHLGMYPDGVSSSDTGKVIQPAPTFVSNSTQSQPAPKSQQSQPSTVQQQRNVPTRLSFQTQDVHVHHQSNESSRFPVTSADAQQRVIPRPSTSNQNHQPSAPFQQHVAHTFQSNLNMEPGQFILPMQNVGHGPSTSVEGPSFVTFDKHNQITLQAMDPFSSKAYLAPSSDVGTTSGPTLYTGGALYNHPNMNPTIGTLAAPTVSWSSHPKHSFLNQGMSAVTLQNEPSVLHVYSNKGNTRPSVVPKGSSLQQSSQPYLNGPLPQTRTDLSQSLLKEAVGRPSELPGSGNARASVVPKGSSLQQNSHHYLPSALSGPAPQTGTHLSHSLLMEAVGRPSELPVSANMGSRDESSMDRSFVREQQATEQLRQRLEIIARKQKNVAATREGLAGGVQMKSRDENGENLARISTVAQPLQRPSPHVHFKEPLVVTNGVGPNQQARTGPPQKSPSISPIPFKVPVVPPAKKTGMAQERRVVVNLPSAWSDVSSTMSL